MSIQKIMFEKEPTSRLPSREWPTVQLHRNRKNFVRRVIKESAQSIAELCSDKDIQEQIALTIYKEKMCLKRMPWPVDDVRGEHLFWRRIEAAFHKVERKKDKHASLHRILYQIIAHYVKGIHSRFQRPHFKFAKRIAVMLIDRLLSSIAPRFLLKNHKNKHEEKFKISGEIELVKAISKKGTIVLLPTHFSNLDSLVVGYMASKIGLPPLMYGAGLNLFNTRLLAYFMNRVGAYKIDRRKKNLIYLETLNAFTKNVLAKGCPLLFFPGGTRSRNGSIEEKLKLGLLSNTLSAQRELLQQKSKRSAHKKIFLVPVVINYHFVLEAPALIRQYLRKTGQERYYADEDNYSTSYRIVSFLVKFFTKGSDVSVSIGRPMDVVGNYVTKSGASIGSNGKEVDMSGYFRLDGVITEDKQRERAYTRLLARRIVENYRSYNEIMVSHLVAFTAFYMLRKQHKRLDLYDFLRLPEDELILTLTAFKATCGKVREHIFHQAKNQKLRYEPRMKAPLADVITIGINYCGMYHARRPLILIKKNRHIRTRDIHSLYYYSNRLLGYGLEDHV